LNENISFTILFLFWHKMKWRLTNLLKWFQGMGRLIKRVNLILHALLLKNKAPRYYFSRIIIMYCGFLTWEIYFNKIGTYYTFERSQHFYPCLTLLGPYYSQVNTFNSQRWDEDGNVCHCYWYSWKNCKLKIKKNYLTLSFLTLVI